MKFVYEPVLTDLQDHPAVRALRSIGLDASSLTSIEVLRKRAGKRTTGKSLVFRLNGLGRGNAIIAKHALWESVQTERLIYQEVLSEAPVNALYCYGAAPDSAEATCGWLFIDEAEGNWFSEENPNHRHLATRWLANLHTSTSGNSLKAKLPAHGLERYFLCLDTAAVTISKCLTNPVLSGNDINLLQQILAHLNLARSSKDWLEDFCQAMPCCLVHGDFVGKNVRVDERENLWVLDWDISGWGIPAVDLEHLDCATYWTCVQVKWPQLSLSDVKTMKTIGVLLRNLGLVQATAGSLEYSWLERTMVNLNGYEAALRFALQELANHPSPGK